VDEQTLIRKTQKGDTDAFADLLTLHKHFVYNLALRTLRNPEEAEDIAQEAFVRAWQALPSFRGQSSFRTWIYRIVLNLCFNRFPHLRRELNDLATEDMHDLSITSETENDPAASLERREQRAFLHREIERLPDSQRLLISLRYQDNMSYDEIAKLLGLPLGTVKTGLFRAKERLYQSLAIYECVDNP
jgi:RNA polymerase sigma-70 factor (ECF subfamily)